MKRVLVVCLCCIAVSAALSAKTGEPKTVITGDEMEIIRGGQTVIFSGNSKVVRGDSILNADKLVQDKKQGRVEAAGNIHFQTYTQDKELVLGSSEKAFYFPEQGQGELYEGRPHVVYFVKTSTGPVDVTADSIAFDEKKEEINARGSVEILTSSGSAYSPSALFLQKDRKIYMTGDNPQPRIVYHEQERNSEYSADRITVFLDAKKVLLDGSVHGKMRGKELENVQEKK